LHYIHYFSIGVDNQHWRRLSAPDQIIRKFDNYQSLCQILRSFGWELKKTKGGKRLLHFKKN